MAYKCSSTPIATYLVVMIIFVIISPLMSMIVVGKPIRPWTSLLPPELQSLDLASRLSLDSNAINFASTDFGKLIQSIPAAVLYPSSHEDIANLIKFSYTNCSRPFSIAARGRGHSVRGQPMALNGVVIDMRSLIMNCGTNYYCGSRIHHHEVSAVAGTSSMNKYVVDVGGEQLWIDVLHATLEHGLSPTSWTDYLYLTVGGTLSNAGISGQSFRYGPQISNVYELDVITGRGETVTCSKHINSELFFAVLGGLGQFGIITRARIALQPAPQRVKWVRMLYHDFSAFTRDQEHLISINHSNANNGGQLGLKNINKGLLLLDYVEGSVILNQITTAVNNWRSSSSFYSSADHLRISSLSANFKDGGSNNIIYSLEVVKHYNDLTAQTVDQELELLFNGLNYIPGFKFTKDVSYVDFLNRVRIEELKLQSQGLWDVPHPWLNLFVPKSQISEFNSGVFHGILKNTKPAGPILLYPTNRNTWDDRMSAIIPDEEIFYSVGLLQSNGLHDWEYLDDQNREILEFCDKAGIKFKQYLPHYETESEWKNHFGAKWDLFQERKAKFDPKAILSPGQRIFNSS